MRGTSRAEIACRAVNGRRPGAVDVSRAPLMASHSSARAIANAPRNMTDEMIVALAKKGGVIQVNFNCGFVSQKFRDNKVQCPRTPITNPDPCGVDQYPSNATPNLLDDVTAHQVVLSGAFHA